MFTTLTRSAIAVAITLTLVGCGSDGSSPTAPSAPISPAIDAIAFDAERIDLLPGERFASELRVAGSGTGYENVTYVSSATGIATVDPAGVVEAVSPGTAEITAIGTDDPTLTASFEVVVSEKPAISQIVIGYPGGRLTVGDEVDLDVTVIASGDISRDVTYHSSHETTVTVSADGRVRAVGAGPSLVTVRSVADPSLLSSVGINVAAAPRVLDVRFDQEPLVLFPDDIVGVSVTVETEGYVSPGVRFEIDDPRVATLGSPDWRSASVLAHAPGSVRITAISNADPSMRAELEVEVRDRTAPAGYLYLANEWRPGRLQVQDGQVRLGSYDATTQDQALWALEVVTGNIVTLRNRATGELLAAASESTVGTGTNGMTTQWILHSGGTEGDFTRLENRAYRGRYLHVEHGQPELGPLQPAWWSMRWAAAAE